MLMTSQEEPLLGPAAPARGHVNGGSMATTARLVELLWHTHRAHRSPPALKVAGNVKRCPALQGFLKASDDSPHGF